MLAVLLGLLIALPLALLSVRYRTALRPRARVTGVLYTIPSLALFALLLPFTGLSRTTALIPLTVYTLLILVRNIVTGLDGVPVDVLEAATGMGYSRSRQLLRVELPLALPAIIAGIRIATVTTIGLVTITALIGQGGLGHAHARRLQPRLPDAADRRHRAVARAGRHRRPAPRRSRTSRHAVGPGRSDAARRQPVA